MPRTTAIRADFEMRIKGLEKALLEGTSLTKAEVRKQLKEHRKIAKAMNQDIPAAARTAHKAMAKNIGGARKLFEGLQGEIGSTGSRILALGEASAALGSVGVALAAVGIGAVAATGGVIGLVAAVDDITKSQEHLIGLPAFNPYPPHMQERMDSFDAALGAVRETAKLIAKDLGAGWKVLLDEALTPVLRNITMIGLAMDALMKGQIHRLPTIWKEADDLIARIAKRLRDSRKPQEDLAKGAAEVTRNVKAEAAARDDVSDAMREQQRIARETAEFAGNRAAMAEALNIYKTAVRSTMTEEELLTAEYNDQLQRVSELEGRLGSLNEVRTAVEEAYTAKVKQLANERMEAQVGAVMAAAQTISSIISQQAEASRAAAIFAIAVDTAAGIMQTIGQWGLPWGLIPAAAVAAAGAIQLSAVKSEPAPTFHAGGLVGPGTRPANDERIRTLTGEGQVGVITRQAMDDMNRGQGGGVTVIQQKLSHRVLDEQIAENSQMTTSSLRRFVRSTRRAPVGKRRRTRSR